MCRDVSCFVFKEMENRKIGITIKCVRNDEEVQRIVMSFVNDGCFTQMEQKESRKCRKL